MPAIEGYFRRMIEQALVNYLQRTESFLLADAHQRYLHFLQTQPDLFRRISVSDLCSYLGIRRQTLTRIRKNMLEPTKCRICVSPFSIWFSKIAFILIEMNAIF